LILVLTDAEPGYEATIPWGSSELYLKLEDPVQKREQRERERLEAERNEELRKQEERYQSFVRDPPFYRPKPPRISVKGDEVLEIGCVTEKYVDGELVERIYALRGKCDLCQTRIAKDEMVTHSQCKIKLAIGFIILLDIFSRSVGERVKEFKRRA
jgi:hypothetical protein